MDIREEIFNTCHGLVVLPSYVLQFDLGTWPSLILLISVNFENKPCMPHSENNLEILNKNNARLSSFNITQSCQKDMDDSVVNNGSNELKYVVIGKYYDIDRL